MATKKESAPGPGGIPYSLHRCAGGLGSQFPYNAYKHVIESGAVPSLFAASRTFFIPKSSNVYNNGRMVRSPEALRPLTPCNCDCKILTTAICCGLQWYTMRCIHPSQRCISSRQMTDNIFEIETTALAHVACSPQESSVLLTDFVAAYPSVNHSWIFHVLEKAELPEFICWFLRMIHCNSTTHVEFAGKTGGQFFMARGVRQGSPASGFLFAMAFDPIFRLLQDTIIPKIPWRPRLPSTLSCACADDFAVAASSFRLVMTDLSSAFVVVDRVPGLNLNHRKCCWVQYGSDRCHELFNWIATNCEEFREMKK